MLFNRTLHVWFSPSRVVRRLKFSKNRGFTLHTSPIQVEQMWLFSTIIFGKVLKLHSEERGKNA